MPRDLLAEKEGQIDLLGEKIPEGAITTPPILTPQQESISPWGKWFPGLKESQQKYEEMAGRTREDIAGIPIIGKPILKAIAPESPLSQVGEQVGTLFGAEQVGRAAGELIPPLFRVAKKVIPESFKTTAKKVFEGIKTPYQVEEGATVGLRKGAEKSMGELENIEQQVYRKAAKGTDKEILTGVKKVNFDSTTEGLNNFEQSEVFGRLHPPEKAQIRSAMKQIRKEISPGARTGKTAISPEEMEDIIQTGTGEFVESAGQVRIPGTFTQARATRSWLSKESHNAYGKGNQNLGNAYKDLKSMHEQDLERAVGTNAWAGWKEADAFKTRKHLMDEMLGWKGKAEIKPGKYNFEKVKTNIKNIAPERFEAAGFSKEEIQNLRSISDVNKFRSFVETHPLLKVLIPVEVMNEILGLKLPMPSVTRAGRYILGRAIGI